MLTEQKKNFISYYIEQKCKNATKAAIRAGYSEKTAYQQAHMLLKSPEIQEYLKERKEALVADIRESFILEAQDALKVMKEILNNPHAKNRDRLTAAREFLDRAGFKPVESVSVSGSVCVKNPYEGLSTEQLVALCEKLEAQESDA